MRTLLAVLVLAAAAVAQRTWIVDAAGGPGVFTDIPPAIAAAAPGDRIEVRGPGPYSEFAVSRGLDIEAVTRAVVPRISVQGMPAGEAAWIAGFDLNATFLTFPINMVQVANCQGPVLLRGIRAASPWAMYPSGQAILVSACASVVLTECEVRPGWTTSADYTPPSLQIDQSRVVLQRSMIEGCRGSYGTGPGPGYRSDAGSHAVVLGAGVELVVSQAGLIGGRGADAPANRPVCAAAGGGAIVGAGSGTVIMGGSLVFGGGGGVNWSTYCPPQGAPGPAISGAGFRVTQDCLVQGTSSATPIASLPTCQSPGQAFQGQPTTLLLTGAPYALVLMLLDRKHGHVLVPGATLPLLLSPALLVGPVLLLGPTGASPWSFVLPPDPAWKDRFLFLQGIVFESASRIGLSSMADLRMR